MEVAGRTCRDRGFLKEYFSTTQLRALPAVAKPTRHPMNFRCPHCQLEMSAENEHAGQVGSCPGCNGRFQIPALPDVPAAGSAVAGKKSASSSQRGGWQEEDHANISFGISLGIAAAVTTLLLLAMLPFKGTTVSPPMGKSAGKVQRSRVSVIVP